jgi:xylulokinase
MPRQLVAGIDSSTQQTKLIVVDAASGDLIRSSALPHPDGTELNPEHWWSALHDAGGTHPSGATAVSITAQQHTAIFLDDTGTSIRDAILWNDSRAAISATHLRQELGDDLWLQGPGLLPDATHPVSKLRWLADHEPDHAARVHSVLLPHDWLTWRLLHRTTPPTTDRSDASATGYWSPLTNTYLPELARHALGHDLHPPQVRDVHEIVGTSRHGILVTAGCGDNAATHLALDTQPGDVVISIGTSTTVSMRTDSPAYDSSGNVDTMADARCGLIPIVAMLNGARVLAATARMLGITLDHLDRLAADAAPAAEGALLLPFLDGERNPPAAAATGSFVGLTRHSMTPTNIARASILGLSCAIVNALEALTTAFGSPTRVLLVGGGARSASLRQAITDISGRPTEWPEHREHAAFGAARQAAWAVTGDAPNWAPLSTTWHHPATDRSWTPRVRDKYESFAAAD